MSENSFVRELHEKREVPTGHNTEVRLTLVRHSQKASAEVVKADFGGMSESDTSPQGHIRSKAWGEKNLAGRQLSKAYATNFNRTRELIEDACQAAGIEVTLLQEPKTGEQPTHKAVFAFPEARRSPEFMRGYKEAMESPKQKYTAAHFPGKDYTALSLDEQEQVMEYANEFAVEQYLAYGDQQPDPNTDSPRQSAAKVAFMVNKLIDLPDAMPNGNKVDLLSAGHKTSSEAFLMYAIQKVGDESVTGLDAIKKMGGSLKILDSWDLIIKNDMAGQKSISLILKREAGQEIPLIINPEHLSQLAQEGRVLSEKI